MEEKGSQNARRITQYVAALVAMGGALSAGAVFGWSSPAQYRLTNQTEYGFPIDDEQWSWVGSTITLGGNFNNLPIQRSSSLIFVLSFSCLFLCHHRNHNYVFRSKKHNVGISCPVYDRLGARLLGQ